MKKIRSYLIILLISSIIFSCGKSSKYQKSETTQSNQNDEVVIREEAASPKDNTTGVGKSEGGEKNKKTQSKNDIDFKDESIMSSSASVVDKKDTIKKFIRTANAKFKVKNVLKSTYIIEDITKKLGGYVTKTSLEANITSVENKQISEDSTLKITTFVVENNIIIRIPNYHLDSILRSFTPLIEFLHFRNIEADDIRFNIIQKELQQRRNAQYLKETQNKTSQRIDIDRNRLDVRESSDNAYLDNLILMDKVEFSTINLNIYQNETFQYEMLANKDKIDAYQTSFWSKVSESLYVGWKVFEALILFALKLWGIAVIFIIIYLLIIFSIKKFKQFKNRKKQNENH